MIGINCSEARAYEFRKQVAVYLSPSTGFWIATDGRPGYRTGDKIEEIPADAFPFSFEITITEAAENYQIPYSTLAEWVREGKLDARKSGGTWLTTPEIIEQFLYSDEG